MRRRSRRRGTPARCWAAGWGRRQARTCGERSACWPRWWPTAAAARWSRCSPTAATATPTPTSTTTGSRSTTSTRHASRRGAVGIRAILPLELMRRVVGRRAAVGRSGTATKPPTRRNPRTARPLTQSWCSLLAFRAALSCGRRTATVRSCTNDSSDSADILPDTCGVDAPSRSDTSADVCRSRCCGLAPGLAVWLRGVAPVRYAVVASRGVWRSLVARFVRDEEAVGSNPATPTVEATP